LPGSPMRSTYSVALSLVAILLLMQIVPAAFAQADAALFELHGKVVNALTGEPIGGALLQVPGQRARFSDSDGNFAFTGLSRGRLVVRARKPGFFDELELGRWVVPDISTEVPTDTPVVVKLTPEAIIYGAVKNAEGEPVEYVEVRVERREMIDGRRQFQVVRISVTDDEGNFRIGELVPGKYYLAFSRGDRNGGGLQRKRKREQGYGLQFYPGVADAVAASAFNVGAGAEVHVTHTLSPQPVFQVSGTVRGASGNGVFDLQLVNSSGEPVDGNITVDRKSGEFQIPGVPAGRYLLTAMQFPAGLVEGPPPTVSQAIQVSGDVSGIVLAFGTGIWLGVQLHDEIPANSAEPHRVIVQLRPKDFARNEQRIIVPPVPEDRRPITKFENLSPGTYSVEAQAAAPQGYVAELRCGSVDLLRADLVIATGAAPPPIDVTLRDDGAQLTVAVKKADRGITVLIYSTDYPRRSSLTFQQAGHTSVSIPNLPPGTYQVLAATDANELEFRNPAAMEKHLGRATSITLQPRDKATVSVEPVDLQEQPE
jgi:uncharacterized protein (DUF2141 family)